MKDINKAGVFMVGILIALVLAVAYPRILFFIIGVIGVGLWVCGMYMLVHITISNE